MTKLILISILFAVSFCSNLAQASDQAFSSFVESNNAFGLDLYHQVSRSQENGNIFFSPLSISTALTMTWAGSQGTSYSEIADVLHYGKDDCITPHKEIHDLAKELLKEDEKRSYSLSLANDIWFERTIRLRTKFVEEMSVFYESSLHAVDFARKTEETRFEINKSIAKRTRGKVKELIAKDDISSKTAVVLTNVIHFHGKWSLPFDEKLTRDAPFLLTREGSVMVPTMALEEAKLKYMRGSGFQMVELPYEGGRFSMILMVPDKVDGVIDVERSLSSSNVRSWIDNMKEMTINVKMPKFSLSDKRYLRQHLIPMGMMAPFDCRGSADFGRMLPDRSAYISKVIHEAHIEVDEKSTEATAATAVIINLKSAATCPLVNANRPFLFLIMDNRSGAILFVGRVGDPTAPPGIEEEDESLITKICHE